MAAYILYLARGHKAILTNQANEDSSFVVNSIIAEECVILNSNDVFRDTLTDGVEHRNNIIYVPMYRKKI